MTSDDLNYGKAVHTTRSHARRGAGRIALRRVRMGWIGVVIAALLAVMVLPGCIRSTSWTGAPKFSRDGKRVFYYEWCSIGYSSWEFVDLSNWYNVHWCDVDNPSGKRSRRIEKIQDDRFPRENEAMRWSPKGNRFAALTVVGVDLFSANSGGRKQILDGSISDCVWMSDDQLVYSTYRKSKDAVELVFCRYQLSTEQTVDVAKLPLKKGKCGLVDFSPDGTKAIVMDDPSEGQFQYVDLRTRTIRALGRGESTRERVLWSNDSSKVFILSSCPGEVNEALLFSPATSRLIDYSWKLAKVRLGRQWEPGPTGWTADGEYLVFNGTCYFDNTKDCWITRGGTLLQPELWTFLRSEEISRRHPELTRSMYNISPLPVAGWVRLYYSYSGKYLKTYTRSYAYNYRTGSVVHLPQIKSPEHSKISVSPDGSTVAMTCFGDFMIQPAPTQGTLNEYLKRHRTDQTTKETP